MTRRKLILRKLARVAVMGLCYAVLAWLSLHVFAWLVFRMWQPHPIKKDITDSDDYKSFCIVVKDLNGEYSYETLSLVGWQSGTLVELAEIGMSECYIPEREVADGEKAVIRQLVEETGTPASCTINLLDDDRVNRRQTVSFQFAHDEFARICVYEVNGSTVIPLRWGFRNKSTMFSSMLKGMGVFILGAIVIARVSRMLQTSSKAKSEIPEIPKSAK